MRKTVLTFGLISGGIVSLMMAVVYPFHDKIGFDRGEILGYTSMLVAFLLIFFGIRSYRDNVGGGSVGFGRAFKVGALIALISSLCYVATWEVIYYNFGSDFLQKYQAHMIEKARAKGESDAAILKKVEDNKKFAELYKNPVINASLTLLEPLPVGLIVALICAALLRRKPSGGLPA